MRQHDLDEGPREITKRIMDMMTQNIFSRSTAGAGRRSALMGTIALAAALLLGLLWAANGLADDSKATVAFGDGEYTLDVPYGQVSTLPLSLTLSLTRTAPVTVTYQVTSTNATAADVQPFGKADLVIPPAALSATIPLTLTHNPAWLTGTKTITVGLLSAEPADLVELDEMITTTVTIRRIYRTPIPVIRRDEAWQRVNPAPDQTGTRSLAVCPRNSAIRYVASGAGLYRWQQDKWVMVKDENGANVPGNAREITFGADCSDVYAAVLGSGVWRETNRANNVWQKVPPGTAGDDLLTSRTIVVHDNWLYTGTDTGIYYTDVGPNGEGGWEQALPDKVIIRLSPASDRLYAAVWTEGVAYSDDCPATCAWASIAGPPGDSYGRDLLGPPGTANEKPDWLMLATASTVYWYDGQQWQLPVDGSRPEPTGNVFTLAQVSDRYYAGIENGGVWVSTDGRSWQRVGNNLTTATIRELVVSAAGELFAATYDAGIWR